MCRISPDRELSHNKPLLFAVRTAARLALAPFFSMKVEGLEHLPAQSGFILLPKHQRWVDVPLMAFACPRPLYFVAKKELFETVAANWFFRGLGGISLNRSRPLESRLSLKAIHGLLDRGDGLVVFPEGTYCPGKVGPGRAGMIRFVCSRSNAPLVPAGIRYHARGARSVVSIAFGKAVAPDAFGNIPVLVDRVMESISVLSGLPRAAKEP
jgi:1-acyl-sn-glycerol-3-phosphate acyltransferase